MNKKHIALAFLCILPIASEAAAEDPKSNTAHQVARQGADYTGLNQAEFEAQLKAKFAGTYAIYNGLPDGEKSEIYKAAATGTDVSKLRSMITASARKRR